VPLFFLLAWDWRAGDGIAVFSLIWFLVFILLWGWEEFIRLLGGGYSQ
jgi:hypothetical protein